MLFNVNFSYYNMFSLTCGSLLFDEFIYIDYMYDKSSCQTFSLMMIGESCSVEKELGSTIATNAVYQDKMNVLFSVKI